jgi:hypothetical protein
MLTQHVIAAPVVGYRARLLGVTTPLVLDKLAASCEVVNVAMPTTKSRILDVRSDVNALEEGKQPRDKPLPNGALPSHAIDQRSSCKEEPNGDYHHRCN